MDRPPIDRGKLPIVLRVSAYGLAIGSVGIVSSYFVTLLLYGGPGGFGRVSAALMGMLLLAVWLMHLHEDRFLSTKGVDSISAADRDAPPNGNAGRPRGSRAARRDELHRDSREELREKSRATSSPERAQIAMLLGAAILGFASALLKF